MMPGIKGMKTLMAIPSREEDDRTKTKNNRESKLLWNDTAMGMLIVNLIVMRLHHEKFAKRYASPWKSCKKMCFTSSPRHIHRSTKGNHYILNFNLIEAIDSHTQNMAGLMGPHSKLPHSWTPEIASLCQRISRKGRLRYLYLSQEYRKALSSTRIDSKGKKRGWK